MSYLKQYQYVIAAAECGSISAAAERLGVSQPTFSKYLKKLEEELGVELLDRSTLPVRPTAAGECFVRAGRRFLDLDRQLTKELADIKESSAVTVRVGISPSRSPYTMPAILSLFKKRCPEGRVAIVEEKTAELNEMLTSGDIDLLISIDGEGTGSFERTELFSEELLLAIPDALTESDPIKILSDDSMISVGRGQAIWRTLASVCEKIGTPMPKIECQSIESAMALVERGIGSTIVPSYIARGGHRGVRFLPIPKEISDGAARQVCLYYRKEQFLSEAEREFAAAVIDCEKGEQ